MVVCIYEGFVEGSVRELKRSLTEDHFDSILVIYAGVLSTLEILGREQLEELFTFGIWKPLIDQDASGNLWEVFEEVCTISIGEGITFIVFVFFESFSLRKAITDPFRSGNNDTGQDRYHLLWDGADHGDLTRRKLTFEVDLEELLGDRRHDHRQE